MSGIFKPPFGAQLNLDHPLSQGLVFCALMNEGSGKNVHDYSGQGNIGTCINMNDPPISTSGWVPGPHGGALAFDGSNDYVQTSVTNLDFNGGTISWWQKANVAFNNNAVIQALWGQLTSGNTNPEFSAQKYTDGKWYVGWNKTADDDRVVLATTASSWPQNSWSYYTFTWVSGGDSILYQNGVQIGSKVGGTTTSNIADCFVIGRQGRASTTFFNGSISSASIYNRALSAEEIAYLYAFPYCMFDEAGYPAWMLELALASNIPAMMNYYRQMRAA